MKDYKSWLWLEHKPEGCEDSKYVALDVAILNDNFNN